MLAGSLGFTAVSLDGQTWRTGSLGGVHPTQAAAFGAGLALASLAHDARRFPIIARQLRAMIQEL